MRRLLFHNCCAVAVIALTIWASTYFGIASIDVTFDGWALSLISRRGAVFALWTAEPEQVKVVAETIEHIGGFLWTSRPSPPSLNPLAMVRYCVEHTGVFGRTYFVTIPCLPVGLLFAAWPAACVLRKLRTRRRRPEAGAGRAGD